MLIALLRSVALLQLAALVFVLLGRHRNHIAARVGAALCLSGCAFLGAQSWLQREGASDAITWAFILGGCAAPSLIWLFSKSFFRDHFTLSVSHIPAVGLAVFIGGLAYSDLLLELTSPSKSIELIDSMMHQTTSLGFLALAAVEMGRDSRHDLVSSRRRLRGQLLLTVLIFAGGVSIVEIALAGGAAPAAFDMAVGLALNGVAAAALVVVLRHGASLFATTATARVRSSPGNGTRENLQAWIAQKGYTDPEVSIASLAEILGTQEYLLRRLLNQELGFRNFRDLLNQHRIAEACELLRAGDAPTKSVLEVSLESGYRSLATFNRAFRAITGTTPTEYRESGTTKKTP